MTKNQAARKSKPSPDVNKGANMFKTRLVAKIKRLIREGGSLVGLLAWVEQSDERAAKKSGGIGRR